MDKPGTLDKSRFAYSTRISSDGRHPRVQAVVVNNAAHLGPDGDPALDPESATQRANQQQSRISTSTIFASPLPFYPYRSEVSWATFTFQTQFPHK
jgi:hypothetical protein